MKSFGIIAAAALLTMSGCATKDYVNEQIAASNQRTDSKHAELAGQIERQGRDFGYRHQEIDGRLGNLQTSVNNLSRTAQEALDRANAAGKLAEGKFMYETVLSGQIAFKLGSDELSADGKKALDELAAKLKSDNKNVYLEIQGHTDSSGSDDANMRLALKRAKAVHRYLAINGAIALHRMSVIALGEAAPVADNKTRKGREENRRVSIMVLQ